ncbi:FtsQ-type POTRA domain-containing protein [Microbacterium sp. RD1]|uniref:FtsQ-type POTRA domain-containing protein n=1 Tax=Microbacterium sp. RD1 TaxID=3457313 RepID=UPI003FA54D7D
MRRPSPLPPPPAPGRDDGAAPAPVVPILPERRIDPAPAPQATPPEPPRAEPPVGPVGMRDVWRASRARRRALRAEVRRFTARQRRRRMLWLGIAAAVVLLVLGTVGAAYSPLFAVERIEVVGTSTLDPAAVTDALAAQVGTPLPLVDESEVKAALVQFPLVESYTLEAQPPHGLLVRIVERTPVGVLETRAGFTVVDAAGVALATTAQAPSGQPMLQIEGGVGSRAFTAAGMVMRSLPEPIRLQVTAVSATTADDVTLTLGGTDTTVVWGSAEDSAEKAVVLERAMISRPPADVVSYDVSSPKAIVVRLAPGRRILPGMWRHARVGPAAGRRATYLQIRNCIPSNSLTL